MDKEQLLELVPHYLAMLLIVFGVLAAVRVGVRQLDFWVEFAIVLLVAFAYRPVVVRLGVAPSLWE
jgi:hypothetical protein